MGAAVRAPQAVDVGGKPRQAQAFEQFIEQEDQLGVNIGGFDAENFSVDLVKLAVSALLGAFPPEHGAEKKKFSHRIRGIHLMLDIGPADGGRGFGPQGELVPFPVFKGVHLFFDDVGGFPDTPGKQPGFFNDGDTDLLVSEGAEQGGRFLFHPLPQGDVFRQYISKPAYGLHFTHLYF